MLFSAPEMEREELEVANELDDAIPAPATFWQKLGLRLIMGTALLGPASAVFVSQYVSARHKPTEPIVETQPSRDHGIDKASATPESTATPAVTVDVIANPPRLVSHQPASLQVTTKPIGATFAIFAGIVADKSPPTSTPVRSGTSPDTVENLEPGNYTIFFQKEGWPDSRDEIQLQAGEVRPLSHIFPHAEVTITSDPSGAEILLGTVSIGFTPLKADLPPGQSEFTARLKNLVDHKQTVTLTDSSTPVIDFQLRTHRHATRARPAPPASFIDKIGGSLRHLFGGNTTAAPRKRR